MLKLCIPRKIVFTQKNIFICFASRKGRKQMENFKVFLTYVFQQKNIYFSTYTLYHILLLLSIVLFLFIYIIFQPILIFMTFLSLVLFSCIRHTSLRSYAFCRSLRILRMLQTTSKKIEQLFASLMLFFIFFYTFLIPLYYIYV